MRLYWHCIDSLLSFQVIYSVPMSLFCLSPPLFWGVSCEMLCDEIIDNVHIASQTSRHVETERKEK
jgi:hypothetical protein